MRSALAVLLSAVLVLGCGDAVTTLPLALTIWSTAPVPSGGSIVLNLSVGHSQVWGSGAEYGVMGALRGNVAITGSWTGSTFDWVLSPIGGAVRPATYTGRMVNTSELDGTWVEAGDSSSLAFYKR